MSRIRSIKPEWLDDERLVLASEAARVLSVALLLLADDAGRGVASPVLLGARVFPTNPSLFEPALTELRPWFVRLYRARGQTFYEVVNWRKHQKIDRPSPPKTPDPREGEPIDDDSGTPRDPLAESSRVLDESSVGARASRASHPLPSRSPPDPDPSRGPSPAPIDPRSSAARMDASFAAPHELDRWVFEEWCRLFGKTGAHFDPARAVCLAERRLAGMTRVDAGDALAGALADPYVMGQKDGRRHDRLSFLLGDADRYEEFRDRGRELREGKAPSAGLSPEAKARRDARLRAQEEASERHRAELIKTHGAAPARNVDALVVGIGGASDG